MATTARDFLAAQVEDALKQAKTINEEGLSRGGNTAEEKLQIEGLLKQVGEWNGKIGEIDQAEEFAKQIADATGPIASKTEEVNGAGSVGDAFVKSDGYKLIKSGAARTNTWTTGAIEYADYGVKATVSESASAIVPTDYRPGINTIPSQPPRVADLFAQGTTDSNLVNFVRETTATNAAAGVSEAQLKPESTLIFTNATTNVRKIATFLPVTDEMLEDVAQIRSYLDSRLSLFVAQAEDSALLTGNGTDPNLLGVLNAGIHTANATALVADNHVDAVYQAITTIRDLSFLDPDAIVFHPTDWAVIRLLKDENGQYYGGGPFTGAYGNSGGIAPNSLWGLPVVLTTSITVNTCLVGAFRTAAMIWRKSGLTVEASNSHLDWFQRNMTAIRAETRLAMAVIRPTGFFKITNLDDSFS